MTSSEVAAWVQGVGTLLAVAASGLTLNWQIRQQHRDHQRREREQRESLARLIQSWISDRRKVNYATLRHTSSFIAITACIKNLGYLVAHDVRLCLKSPSTDSIISAWRMLDALPPSTDQAQVTWLFDVSNTNLLTENLALITQFTLASQTWEQTKGHVKVVESKQPPVWQRIMSQIWLESSDVLTSQQLNSLIKKAIFAAIDQFPDTRSGSPDDHYESTIASLPVREGLKAQLVHELNDTDQHFNKMTNSTRDARLGNLELMLYELSQSGTTN